MDNNSKPFGKRISYISTILFLLILGVFFLFYVFYDNEDNKKQQVLNTGIGLEFNTSDVTQIEYGSNVDAMDFVKTYKGTIKKPEIDTKTLGLQKLKFSISVDGYEKNFYKQINVVDSQMPSIKIKKGDFFQVEKGESFHLDENDVVANDPVDGNLAVAISGEVNTNQVGDYVLAISTADHNGNLQQETVSVRVYDSAKQGKFVDTSLGQKLDHYTLSINNATVRGRNVKLEDDPKKNITLQYLMQINTTPSYLLEYVDEFVITSQSKMESDLKVKNVAGNTIVGHTVNADGKSIVYLNGDSQSSVDTVIHECAHAYGYKTGILELDDFKKLYQSEASYMPNMAAQKDIGEFFAYSYALYVTQGAESLATSCPKTAKFFMEYQI